MSSTPLLRDAEEDVPVVPPRPSNEEIAAWILLAAALLFILVQHLTSALVTGLALYLILDRVSRSFSRRLSGTTARPLALLIVALVTIGAAVGAVFLAVTVIRHSASTIPAMMNQMANILESTRTQLGDFCDEIIPDVLTD